MKQMIATVISIQNKCRYCSATHTGALNALGVPQEQIDSCATDPELDDIPEPQRSVLLFARKVAGDPHAIRDEDFAILRDMGMSETELLEICMTASLMNFINTWAEISNVPLDGSGSVA
jgi:uncharacterized peroxidase-related enzyme